MAEKNVLGKQIHVQKDTNWKMDDYKVVSEQSDSKVETDYFSEITSKEELIFYQESDKTLDKVKSLVMGDN